MSGRSLFDRLEHPDPSDTRNFDNEGDLIQSIRTNLQRILNTRHQTSRSAPDYGTSDLSGLLRGAQSLHLLKDEMLHSIRRFEPRLTEVELDFATDETKDPHMVFFEVTARIVTPDGESPAVFRSSISPGGLVRVLTA